MNSSLAQSHFKKDKQRIEDLKKEFALMKTLKLDNVPISLFDFRIFPPNCAIVAEGDKEDCIWFIKTGKLRLLKVVKFEQRKMPDGTSKLIKIPDTDQIVKKGQALTDEKEKKIIVKLLKIKELGPGDYLGNHRGLLHYTNEASADPDVERDFRNSQSPSQVTVITNTRAEMVGLTRFEFHKISTEATGRLLDYHSEFRTDVDEISESFMENHEWDKYRKAIFKLAIADAKAKRHRKVVPPYSETQRE